MTELASSELVAALTWSVILVFITIAVHFTGIAMIALVVPSFWEDDVSGRKTFLDTLPGTVAAITVIAFLLAILHGIEAFIWGIVYLRLGVLTSMADALLYSVGAMSTAGSGLTVQVQWRNMGAIEAFDGMLLFGISTAFIFSFMKYLWRSVRIRRASSPSK